MARNPPSRKPEGPLLSPEDGVIQLKESLRRGKKLVDIQPLPKERFDAWSNNAFATLRAACGEDSSHLYTFVGETRFTVAPLAEQYAEPQRRAELERLIQVLEAVIDEWPSSPQKLASKSVTADTSRLTPGQKRSLLKEACEKGEKLLEPPFVLKQYYKVWNEKTLEMLKSVFGETSSVVQDFENSQRVVPKQGGTTKFYSCPDGHQFTGIVSVCPHCGKRGTEDSTRLILMKQIQVLNAEGWMLPTDSLDFFEEFDPDIQKVSKQRFNDGQYADAVSAAFKQLNNHVKAEYKKQKNKELDGTSLMQTAFSPNSPTFKLADDLTTETGKNLQTGFMQLFAGSMIGIRNPHAHENLTLDFAEAKHFLYLADLLTRKFKSAL